MCPCRVPLMHVAFSIVCVGVHFGAVFALSVCVSERACFVVLAVQEKLVKWGVQGAKDSLVVSACAAVAMLNLRVVYLDAASAIYNAFSLSAGVDWCPVGVVAPTAVRMKEALEKATTGDATTTILMDALSLLGFSMQTIASSRIVDLAAPVFKVVKTLQLLSRDSAVPSVAQRWATAVLDECPAISALCKGKKEAVISELKKVDMDKRTPKIKQEMESIVQAVEADIWKLSMMEHMAMSLHRSTETRSAEHSIPTKVTIVIHGSPLLVAVRSDSGAVFDASGCAVDSTAQVTFGDSESPFVLVESSCPSGRVVELGIRSDARFS